MDVTVSSHTSPVSCTSYGYTVSCSGGGTRTFFINQKLELILECLREKHLKELVFIMPEFY